MQNNRYDKIYKDKLAESGVLYQKYFVPLKEFLRYHKEDYYDIKLSIEKANEIYRKKLAQLNAIIFTLDLLYSSNPSYDMKTRELFGWSIELIRSRILYALEQQLKDFVKED